EALAVTKVIVVLFGDLLGSIPEQPAAIIDAILPCELSGQAMPEILYGGVNPSDKLAITYPKDLANAAIP
ncbi:hypothetical protein PR003_g30830, partial [Phytophthora rubi]